MAQALGYVTETPAGGFEGTLNMVALKTKIAILPNAGKDAEAQPDFRVYTEDRVEIGGGWKRTGRTSGRDYVSLTFAAPELGPQKIYANLGRAAGDAEGTTLAILWNPRD